jgi:hypothetical protein
MKRSFVASFAFLFAFAAALVASAAQVAEREYRPAATVGVFDVSSGERIAEARRLVGARGAGESALALLVVVPLPGKSTTAGDVYADETRVNKRRLSLERRPFDDEPASGAYALDLGEAEARALFAASHAAIVTEEFRVELAREELATLRAVYDEGAK